MKIPLCPPWPTPKTQALWLLQAVTKITRSFKNADEKAAA
jgi:hypothetical protein